MAQDGPRLIAIPSVPGPRFAALLERAWSGGDAVFPLDPRLPEAARARLLQELRPGALWTQAGGLEVIRDGRPIPPGTALVVATSGTGGAIKAVELSQSALAAAAEASARRIPTTAGARWLACLPLHHIAGLMTLVRARHAGSGPVVHDGFDVDAVAAERDATIVSLVPTMLFRLLERSVDLARFEAILVGGGPVDPGLLTRARAAGAKVVATYGMTETCGGVVYDGIPLDDVWVDVAENGEIAIAGPTLMTGYRGRPDLTDAALNDGWFKTRDIGMLDVEGRLVVLGRADDAIVTSGNKVFPGEVEGVLRNHPLVEEVAVVGVPDSERGEAIVALVVSSSASIADQLVAHAAGSLPRYKCPTRVMRVGALPRTGSGKIDRAALPGLARDVAES